MTKRDVEKATAELQGFLEPALKFPASFGGQRSIRQTLRQTLASCLTAYSKGHAGRAARPRDLACTPHPNSASRRRLSDRAACTEGNGQSCEDCRPTTCCFSSISRAVRWTSPGLPFIRMSDGCSKWLGT